MRDQYYVTWDDDLDQWVVKHSEKTGVFARSSVKFEMELEVLRLNNLQDWNLA